MVDSAKALQKLWKDSLTVTEYVKKASPDGASVKFEEAVVLAGQPCKLSFVTLKFSSPNGGAVQTGQIVKLFLDKGVPIKPGSKLAVRRGGSEFVFRQSGLPGIFSHHQEILLVPFEGWA